MGRCWLTEIEGDEPNAVLSAAGMNSGKLFKAVSLLRRTSRSSSRALFRC